MGILEGYEEFLKLRKYVMDSLSKIDMSWGHKSYEGTFELSLLFPGYFDTGSNEDLPEGVEIKLHCYVLGPYRHYTWRGKTLKDAVKKCKTDVEQWVKDEQDDSN